MKKDRIFTISEVAHHKSKLDCWLTINGRVLDVTKFLEEHPGGEEILLEAAGKDATNEFENTGHSKTAEDFLLKFQVGYLKGYNIQEAASVDDCPSHKKSKTKEAKAFVIEHDLKPKYAMFIEFFVPLLVAVFYLYYRYLTGAIQFIS